MRLSTFFILSALLTHPSGSLFAAEFDCSHLLKSLVQKAPAPLPLSKESVRIEGEQFISGRVLTKNQNLSRLDDGTYVYIIDREGTIAFSNRVPDLHNTTEPLASHRSVYEKLKSVKKTNPEIVAAGEIEIHQHRVSMINNKSGSWRGDAQNLAWAETVLAQRGLPVETKTVRMNLAAEEIVGKHNSELQGAQAWVQIYQDSTYRGMYEKLHQAETIIANHYPSEIPGQTDWQAFLSSTNRKIVKSDALTQTDLFTRSEWFGVIQILNKSSDYTEFPVQFLKLIDTFGTTRVDRSLTDLLRLEGVLGK